MPLAPFAASATSTVAPPAGAPSAPAGEPARARLPVGELLVLGGRQRRPRSVLERGDAWYGYGQGVILTVTDEGVRTSYEYESPPDACGPDDPVLFKSATYRPGRLYACTQTEVLVLAVPSFETLAYHSLPCFNDVHHVVPTPQGTLLVANSGLEMVVELARDGSRGRCWNVLGEDPWGAFSPDVDYRVGHDLKPHRAHPNHVFFNGDEPFVTRFECRDAVSLADPSRRIALSRERVHDGVVHGDHIFFTSVDGCVLVVDRHTLALVETVELTTMGDDDALLGWCRGLWHGGDHVWVGFSRIRHTRFRQTLSWVRTGAVRSCPTRIARYRLPDWTCDVEVDLEPHGLNAVFTVAAR